MRLGEIRGLLLEDIHSDRIEIRHNWQEQEGIMRDHPGFRKIFAEMDLDFERLKTSAGVSFDEAAMRSIRGCSTPLANSSWSLLDRFPKFTQKQLRQAANQISKKAIVIKQRLSAFLAFYEEVDRHGLPQSMYPHQMFEPYSTQTDRLNEAIEITAQIASKAESVLIEPGRGVLSGDILKTSRRVSIESILNWADKRKSATIEIASATMVLPYISAAKPKTTTSAASYRKAESLSSSTRIPKDVSP
jgi:hypothetical protein